MRFKLGLASAVSIVAMAWAGNAHAGSADCEGWDISGFWGRQAYATAMATLSQNGQTVEVQYTSDLNTSANGGTLDLRGDWTHALSGDYVVVLTAMIYSGLGHAPQPGELESWPLNETFPLRATFNVKGCVPPPPVCGNGVLEGTEICDDGNSNDGDGCSANCTIEPRCGDGALDQNEECDDGNNADGDGCSAVCTIERTPVCGDGILDEDEECDDGNNVDGDGCSHECKIEVEDPSSGCTYTQGFWKNHNVYGRRSQYRPWPISENTRLCGRTWLDILKTPVRGDAWMILAHQWIAAKLNRVNASGTDAVDAALARGEFILGKCTCNRSYRDEATDLASLLDAYNNGLVGPGHCDGNDPDEDCDGHKHHKKNQKKKSKKARSHNGHGRH